MILHAHAPTSLASEAVALQIAATVNIVVRSKIAAALRFRRFKKPSDITKSRSLGYPAMKTCFGGRNGMRWKSARAALDEPGKRRTRIKQTDNNKKDKGLNT